MRRVVITGIGVISPVGNNAVDFWDSLTRGICGIGPITRFDPSDHKAKLAAEVKDFDPKTLYNSPAELRRADLYTHYAIAAADEAIRDSRITESELDPFRLGVYVGSSMGGVQTFGAEAKTLAEKGASRVSPLLIPKMISNMAAGMIAIRHGAKGPVLPVSTACATSAHAIGEAFRAIKHGYADAVIAGGSEAAIEPLSLAGFTACKALHEGDDPLVASIPFDARRSGFVPAEGAGILLLEEYERAVARGAKIYAELAGYGNTCDAYHMTSPDPEAAGAVAAICGAMQEAKVRTEDAAVTYVNAHGTSTRLNDKTETLAFKRVFGEAAYELHISSTKSMTGHMLGAAGAAEAIACALALKEGVVPPTVGYREADPECDLDYTPVQALRTELRYAISTNLGFGGHNAALVLKKI